MWNFIWLQFSTIDNKLLGLNKYFVFASEVDIVEKAQRDHYLKMMNTQHEIEALRAEAYLRQIRDYLNPPVRNTRLYSTNETKQD